MNIKYMYLRHIYADPTHFIVNKIRVHKSIILVVKVFLSYKRKFNVGQMSDF